MKSRIAALVFGFAGLATCLAAPAAAQSPDPFALLDRDRDSFLSYEELSAIYSQFDREFFNGLDLDQDEKISREEWQMLVMQSLGGLFFSGTRETAAQSGPIAPTAPTAPGLSRPRNFDLPAPSGVAGPNPPGVNTTRSGANPQIPHVSGPSVGGPTAPTIPQVNAPRVAAPQVPAVPVPVPQLP